jgi:hypothetical protein
VKVGLAATLKSDAYADRTFAGTILAIAPGRRTRRRTRRSREFARRIQGTR